MRWHGVYGVWVENGLGFTVGIGVRVWGKARVRVMGMGVIEFE